MTDNIFRRAPNQEGYWLNADRLRAYSVIFITIYAIAAVAWVFMSNGMVDPTGKPLGYDFTLFWSASKVALGGDFVGVFDQEKMFAVEHQLIQAEKGLYPWNYPPQYLLVVLPLSLLPYVTAFFVWNLALLAFFLVVVYRWAPSPLTVLVAIAFPATFWNLTHGQNGILVAALLGGALLVLDRRPILAGVLIGLMSFKPHMGLLIPIALLAGRHWTAFASATATTIAFALLSTVVVGLDGWSAFLHSLSAISGYVESGANPWPRMTSLFTGLRMLGVDTAVAYAAQIASAIMAAVIVGWVWSRRGALAMRAAVLAAAIPLATPYAFDYDLAMLAIPMAILAADGYRRGWFSGEREVLIVIWLTPLVATNLASGVGVHIGYLCVLALFLTCTRRALAPSEAFLRPFPARA